jgi:hypothetical protein
MFRDMRWPLIIITGVMLLAVLGAFLSGRVSSRWHIASLSLILAGGVGNLIDRVSLGYVIDYIDFRAIHFAIFNLADSCITVGAVLLCFSIFYRDYIKDWRKKAPEAGLSDGEAAAEEAGEEETKSSGNAAPASEGESVPGPEAFEDADADPAGGEPHE